MKNILLIFIGLLLFTSCEMEEQKEKSSFHQRLVNKHEIVFIGDCEYVIISLEIGTKGYSYFTHKGDCKNPIHIYYKR